MVVTAKTFLSTDPRKGFQFLFSVTTTWVVLEEDEETATSWKLFQTKNPPCQIASTTMSLSLSLTHTHTHSLSHYLSLSFLFTTSFILSLFHYLFSHCLSLSLPISLSFLALLLTISFFLFLISQSTSFFLSLSLSFYLTMSLSCSPNITFFLNLSLSHTTSFFLSWTHVSKSYSLPHYFTLTSWYHHPLRLETPSWAKTRVTAKLLYFIFSSQFQFWGKAVGVTFSAFHWKIQ